MAVRETALKRDSPQAQPHNSSEDNTSDPSSSFNSTTMTGSPTHARSNSSTSEVSPVEEESKFFTANSSGPPSPNEVRSASQRPQEKNRARSSSGGMLARLTSRSSSYISDFVDSGSTITSHVSIDSIPSTKPKLDKASLSKSRGKYKSGVNWDSSPMNLAAGEEPFMEQIAPSVAERTKEEVEDSIKVAELEEMAAAGSTKAALAWSRANSFGDPIFKNNQRAMADPSPMISQQGSSSPLTSGSMRTKSSSSSRFPVENGRSSNLRYNSSEMNGISEHAVSKGDDSSREGSQSMHSQDLISGVGQQVLDSARRAAADSQDAQETQPTDQLTLSQTLEAIPESQKAAKTTKRRTFLGFGGGKKEKIKEKGSAVPEEADDEADEGANMAGVHGQVNRPDETPSSISGPNSRRRRFNDTRQLDLLANELAAEALMGSPESYPYVMPETRRASMMSMLVATNGDLGASSSNTSSQVSLQQQNGLNALAMPQPAFANDFYRSASPGGTGNSSRSGSPRIMGNESPRFEPPRAPFARSQQSLNPSIAPLGSQKAKLTGLPADMLTGLGDGPYPFLAPREREMSDPNVMPLSLDGDINHQGSRNSLPNVFATRSRVASAGSVPMLKRSVLQMSMTNPELELQGLTKPPKSSRSTPFGSRAPSKQVTPHASSSNLREKANFTVSPTLLSKELAKNKDTRDTTSPREESKMQSSVINNSDQVNVESQNVTKAKKEDKKKAKPAAKEARRSLFGRKSKTKLGEEEMTSNGDNVLTPPLPIPAAKTHSLHSTNGGPSRIGGIGNRLRAASRSAHDLVKMPSPTQSNATTSASSHDRGAFTYSSDGGSQQQGFSAVTTPEALPAKLELTSMPPMQPSLPAVANGNSPVLPMNDAFLQPNKASPMSPTPRSMSSTSKTSTNTIARMSKLKSMFASKSSSVNPRTTTITNSIGEKYSTTTGSPLSSGTRSPNEGAQEKKEKTLKYFQNKISDKVLV